MSITNLEKEMADSLGKEFQKTMDFEIMADIMVDMRGYVRLEIDYGPNQRWDDVIAWVGNNCSGEYQEHNGTWIFELEEDAVLFRLKWQ
jgi:hypothetical protein